MYYLRTKTKAILTITPILILSILTFHLFSPSLFPKPNSTPKLHIHRHLQSTLPPICQATRYPDLCASALSSSFHHLTSTHSPQQTARAAVNYTIHEAISAYSNCSLIKTKRKTLLNSHDRIALNDCIELLDETIAELYTAFSDLAPQKSVSRHYNDLQTLLSAAMTNQYTCLDGLNSSRGVKRDYEIEKYLKDISGHVSNTLVMIKKIPGVDESKSGVFDEHERMKDGFASWVSSKDRKLLQLAVNQTRFDLVVAKDGTGNFSTIGAAVAAAPNSSATRFVIYIKAGTYLENVEVQRRKTNLMFIGDGIGKTVVKASRNVVDGWTTFRSATVAVVGDRFIAKGITFENSAGPSKHQAVALRSGSDLSAFYQCSFIGYQDTLYVHSLRQFYRDCDIYGTIDFIFGNAAVVFQNCNLYARRPNANQRNLFTAQGREDPNQNTGISILNSKVTAASDLIPVKSSFRNYLGRPWKEYSRTVYLQSYIDDLIDPAGWLEWNGSFALSTLYYGEYKNRGPGSNTSGRVTWPGYRVINSSSEASQFTVGAFIQGNEWLNSTNIPFFSSLI